MSIRWLPPVLALIGALLSGPMAEAHFNLNLNVRILHVEHTEQGLRIHLRTPMPYLVADRIGAVGAAGLPAPAPFTKNRHDGDRVVHFVDWAALERDPAGLGRISADGLAVTANGRALPVRVEAVRAHVVGNEPGFATLEEALAAMAAPQPAPSGETYVGDTVIDLRLVAEANGPVAGYTIAATLDPGLPGQQETANLILDHGPDGTRIYRVRGLMAEPVEIEGSAAAAASTFVVEGVRHILEGPDHVLFVLCLVLGAAGLRPLIARITGFTVGHSVTLTLGFLGFVPSGGWFVPAVEAGIALSIVLAALAIIRPAAVAGVGAGAMVLVTASLGLLHGLGFSFVLHEILRVDAPNLWQSLLAFNVGIEIGQIAVVLVLIALGWAYRVMRVAWPGWAHVVPAYAIGGLAAVWTIERVIALVQS